MEKAHPYEAGLTKTQSQISKYAINNPPQVFHYSDVRNRDELARMVVVEHLSFSFSKTLGFIIIVKML